MTGLPVLVVDDDRAAYRSISDVLRAGRFSVDFAQSGGVALEACSRKLYELVILDVNLADEAGVDLLATIESQLPEADFLVISGYASEASRIGVRRRPKVGFLKKPLEPERLLGIAERIADRRELIRRNQELERRAEQAEARWRSTVDAIGDPIALVSPEGGILRANAALGRAVGRPPNALEGLELIETVFGRAGAARGIAAHEAAVGGNRAAWEESSLVFPGTFSAGLYPVEVDGERAVVLHLRDITESKLDEERLSGAQWRYRELFDQAPVMYVVCHGSEAEPRIVDCNRTWTKTLGYAREEMIGRPLAEFYSEQSRLELLDGGYRTALEGIAGYRERQLVTKRGDVIETVVSATPDVDVEGRVIGTRATYVDITERKRAEAQLRKSEEKYRSLFEDSRDTVYVSNEEGRVLDINPAGVELLGFESKEELQATNARDFYLDASRRREIVSELLEQGYIKDAEIVLLNRDGTRRDVLETAVAMRDESSGEITFRGMLRDITESKRLEEAAHRSQRMEAIGRLSGGIAHDFNNLLTSIKIYASLALKRCPMESELFHDLRQVADTADRAAELIDQLLAFSRQQLLQPRVLSMNEVVANLEEILRRTISEDVRLECELDPELWMVEADPVQMEQVVMNLILNARDALSGGGRIDVRTRNVVLESPGELEQYGLGGPCVLLEVSDSGSGMDAETVARVFDPFFTTKEQGKGTGLGLATVYGIVKQSGGGIVVESEPDLGATFRIVLPRVSSEVERLPPPTPVEGIEGSAGGERVLVVEDEEILRLVVGRALEEKGYEVLLARDAEQALEVLGDHGAPIDLLLSDVVLPGMDGRELAERVKSLCPGAQVIWMTGYVDRPLTHGGKWVSKERVLRKPFNLTEMEKRVRGVLDERASRSCELEGS